MTIRRTLFILLLLVCFNVRASSAVLAQGTPFGLSVSPPLDVVDIDGKDHLTLAFTVENISGVDMSITPTIQSFHSDQQSGAVILDEGSSPSFVTIQTPGFSLHTPFVLAAGKQQQLVLSITVPPNLMRDITLTFLAEGKPSNEGQQITSSTSTNVRTTVGANMILKIKGNSSSADLVTLEQLKAPSVLDVFSSLPLDLVAHNNDVTTHQTHGTLTLSRGGGVISTYTLSPDMLLPNSSRVIRFLRDKDGNKEPVATDITGPFLPGQYLVSVNLSSEEGTVHSYTTTVLILPLSLFALFVVFGVLTSLGFYAIKKRRKYSL